MKLLHYSHKPVEAVHSVEQRDPGQRLDKPRGFWVSVQGPDDWYNWCKSENFVDCDKQHAYEVVLAADAKLLMLADALDIDCLSERYGVEKRYHEGPQGIDWKRIAGEYQGIIIAPYIWERRLYSGAPWYYGWDCASGCIWDAAAIASLAVERAPVDVNFEVYA